MTLKKEYCEHGSQRFLFNIEGENYFQCMICKDVIREDNE